ncbi:MAG: hypothetical protein IT236_08855 [Bacteroidia bacterium]|nr:hypothetical protein [Bacteroidia bacterium]
MLIKPSQVLMGFLATMAIIVVSTAETQTLKTNLQNKGVPNSLIKNLAKEPGELMLLDNLAKEEIEVALKAGKDLVKVAREKVDFNRLSIELERVKINAISGGGANINNIRGIEQLQIQMNADKWEVEITVIGGRARGTSHIEADWDYIVSAVKPGMLHDLKFRLPKSPSNRTDIGRARLEIFDVREYPVDKSKPHITFFPYKFKNK